LAISNPSKYVLFDWDKDLFGNSGYVFGISKSFSNGYYSGVIAIEFSKLDL